MIEIRTNDPSRFFLVPGIYRPRCIHLASEEDGELRPVESSDAGSHAVSAWPVGVRVMPGRFKNQLPDLPGLFKW